MNRDGFLISAHAGDSRAVLATEAKKGAGFVGSDLTTDHKPELEGEKKRIHASGGQVRHLEGDVPHRVFVKGKMYPGLAMSRSIGDTVGQSSGVTSVPDVNSLKIE